MRHWWQIAVRDLRGRYVRAVVSLIAIALGVALVTAVTAGYSSARQTIIDWNYSWVGRSDVHVQPIPSGLWTDPRLPRSLRDEIAALDGVRKVVTRQKEYLLACSPTCPDGEVVYGYGIELPGEAEIRQGGLRLLDDGRSRMLEPGESGQCLIEEHLARTLGKNVGDTITLVALPFDLRVLPPALRNLAIRPRHRMDFRVAGILSRPRMSMISNQDEFTLRDLVMVSQADLARLYAAMAPAGSAAPAPLGFECIDVILRDGTAANMRRAAERISALPRVGPSVEVSAADEKLAQLDRNLWMFRLASRTVSIIALLTAGYIIFTTLGMGMVQRQGELGMLRCIGATRRQVAAATFIEAAPIAVLGVSAGLALGVLAAWIVVQQFQTFFTRLVVSGWGLAWSGGGGLAAVALAMALPAYLASRVSPLAASRPQTQRTSLRSDLLLGALGLAMVLVSGLTRSSAFGPPLRQLTAYLVVGLPLLYLGYFVASPMIVATAGWLLKFLAAAVLRVRPRLLDDQMQTARWRTAATCCALMVGLSMLVGLRVHSESIIRGWQLPTELPPGFLFFFEPLDRRQLDEVRRIDHVADPIPLMSFWMRYQVGPTADDSTTVRFLAGPLKSFRELVHLNFLEGDPDSAFAAIERGGAIVVTREFATRWPIRLGQKVRFWRHNADRRCEFTVVGIVESLTMDMAVDYLNLRDRYGNLAAGAVIGNVADGNRILAEERVASPASAPAARPAPAASDDPIETRMLLFDFADAGGDVGRAQPVPPARQREMLEQIGQRLGQLGIDYWAGSLVELRDLIVGEFRALVDILQRIALWAMMLASLGVGFAMAANVHSRRRVLAVLRAVGITRGQLARLVLAEAVTVALIGSLLGLIHGLHLAANSIYFDRLLFRIKPQWAMQPGVLLFAISFAVACCLFASLVPAVRAARTNILAALHRL